MGFLIWLEATGFADWVRASYVGYPMMIASHALGMAVMVGISIVLGLRLLGPFAQIPYHTLRRFLPIAWAGFAVNFLSGAALFAAQATTYIVDVTFLSKIGLVFGGAATVGLLQTAVAHQSSGWAAASAVPRAIRLVAIVSLVCWVGATITGRLIAYL